MAKKKTGDKAASAAGTLLAFKSGKFWWEPRDWTLDNKNVTRLVREVAASALSQDETRGQAKRKRK